MRRLALHMAGASLEECLRRELNGLAKGWLNQLIAILDELAAGLLTALEQSADTARAGLEASLRAEGHAPQAALYNAFVLLFRQVQFAMNEFPRRLIEFYYTEILQQDRLAAMPAQQDSQGSAADRINLTFTTAEGVAEGAVPMGTLFSAGKDADGAAINYAADHALTVYPAAITQLRTLTVTQEPLIPGSGETQPAQVLGGIVALSDLPPAIATPFPLFGDTQPGTSGVLTTTPASLGFAVVSPCLMLTGGDRTITLGLTV